MPAFRHIEQSSDAPLHHDTIARPPAPPVPPEDETDNKSEPQIPESGQSVVGLCGVGKTWLACALAQAACRDGVTVLYKRVPRLFDELELAHADGRFPRLFRTLTKTQLLILNDWGPDRLNANQRRDLMEIVEDRYGAGSILITSQLPLKTWHDVIGEPTFADAILDRLVHNAYRLELEGQSFRKMESKTGDEKPQS